ncbi:hypothetical protein [Phaffia rhodozyma]|uniref:Uncharacterized protein n=1 Tax=Phaffia rhodozyma TaxID=264483 RepID=A0A0F7SXN2_PHARH|nr:hypothetical protein [Phaffia rhodozyma]
MTNPTPNSFGPYPKSILLTTFHHQDQELPSRPQPSCPDLSLQSIFQNHDNSPKNLRYHLPQAFNPNQQPSIPTSRPSSELHPSPRTQKIASRHHPRIGQSQQSHNIT